MYLFAFSLLVGNMEVTESIPPMLWWITANNPEPSWDTKTMKYSSHSSGIQLLVEYSSCFSFQTTDPNSGGGISLRASKKYRLQIRPCSMLAYLVIGYFRSGRECGTQLCCVLYWQYLWVKPDSQTSITSLWKYVPICTLTWKERLVFDLWVFHSKIHFHDLAELGILFFSGRILTPKKLSMWSNFFLWDQKLLFYGEFYNSTALGFLGYFFPWKMLFPRSMNFQPKFPFPC